MRTITIGGLHGTGKTSVADRVSKHFDLRRISAGGIFRNLATERDLDLEEFSKIAECNEEIDRILDARQKAEAEKGYVVMDGQLAGWMAGEFADFKIQLTAPLDVRVRRIAERDNVEFEVARQETIIREDSESKRYYDYYGIDISDLTIYDLILNTERFNLDEVTNVIVHALDLFFSKTHD